VDEGNFVKEDVYLEALLPVVQQKNTILIILTTPLGLDNATSRLFDQRDDKGKHIIHTVRIGASCADCKAARVLCKHNESATGEGLSRKKRDKFMFFYQEKVHVALREFGGEPGDSGRTMFKNEWLLDLIQKQPHETLNVAKFIMVGIDPAQGGKCEWGFCACYFDTITHTQVIIHLDACRLEDVSNNGIMLYLKDSIEAIRWKHRYFRNLPILIACEAAPTIIGENIASVLQILINKGEVYNVHLMYELPNERPGVPKTHENTQRMVSYMQQLLENDQVAFSDVFGTNTKSPSGDDEECIKAKLISQTRNVQRRPIRTPRADGTISYRLDGKGGGQDDDLWVAWAMIIYWYYAIMGERNLKYQHIVGNTHSAIRLGGPLDIDENTGKTRFAQKRHANTTYNFNEAQVNPKTGKLMPIEQIDRPRNEHIEAKRRHNSQHPNKKIF
jgi:hypothetical protein